jgi:photosystem II stability/assembly factor-like uncharacterized protein
MKYLYKTLTLLLILLFLNTALLIDNCMSQWVQMSNEMGNITVYSVSSNGNNIYACAGINGAYKSSDNGENWTAINNGLSGHYVWTIKAAGNNLFAGTYAGVYLSTDNGGNWIPVNNGLPNQLVYCILVHGSYLFAGHQTNGGMSVTTDNGNTWNACGLSGQSISSLAGYGNNIFAGTGGSTPTGIYLSTDNGGYWTAASNGLLELKINAIISNGNFTFAGSGLSTNPGRVYRSTNNGGSWVPVNNGITNIINNCFAMDAINLFVGGDSGIFFSNNNGDNWIKRNQGFNTIPVVRSLLIMNGYIFSGTSQSVWRRSLSEIITNTNNTLETVPESYSLFQNYPNPFNPCTVIRFEIQKSEFSSQNSAVTLIIYDLMGREVQTLVNDILQPGMYETTFDGSNYSSGVYFYQMRVGDFCVTKRLILLK